MNIQIVAALASRAGGADVYTEELAIGLAERGHNVTVVCHGASERVQDYCRTAIADLPDYDALPAAWRIAPWLRQRFWRQYLAKVRLSQPDVIVCSKAICLKPISRRFPNVPSVYLPHSRIEPVEVESTLIGNRSWLQRRLACGISASAERWCLLHATTTVRFSRGAIDDMRRYYSLPSHVRFDVIPAGINASQVRSVIDPARVPSQEIRLLSVGRLVESKNLAFLLHCLAKLSQETWRLDIVGDGPDRSRLEQIAASLNLGQRVYFHGHRDAIDGFYTNADLFVFPSRLESYGLVILEAMARGVPTLAIAADGQRYQNANAEIITDGVDGLVAANENEFHSRLADCLAQRIPLDELGRHSRETFERRHQWPAVLDRWEELLTALTNRHHQAAEAVAV